VHEEIFATSNDKIHSAQDTLASVNWSAVLRHTKVRMFFFRYISLVHISLIYL
jgi:hypothetical protein